MKAAVRQGLVAPAIVFFIAAIAWAAHELFGERLGAAGAEA